jgi:hypothetical protein
MGATLIGIVGELAIIAVFIILIGAGLINWLVTPYRFLRDGGSWRDMWRDMWFRTREWFND